ncbi:hypothetical protein [Chromobacterium vaccinii]|uniref:hypothetical protein n=1 Tax=Chromobacterium vaccinii TaxID=1108595 RepID=UPI0034585FFD
MSFKKTIRRANIVWLGMGLLMSNFVRATNCLVLGDSIAVGIKQGLPECVSQAKVGLSTRQIIKVAPNQKYQIAIISTGSNDGENVSLLDLRILRSNVQATRIVWVIPSHKLRASSFVKFIAREFGDYTIEINPVLSKDNIHPTYSGYKRLSLSLVNFFNL